MGQMTHLVNKLLIHWTANLGLYQGGPSKHLLLGALTPEHAIGAQLDDMAGYRLANRSIQEQHVQSQDPTEQMLDTYNSSCQCEVPNRSRMLLDADTPAITSKQGIGTRVDSIHFPHSRYRSRKRLPPKGWAYDTQLDHTKRAFSHAAGLWPPVAAPPMPFEPCLGAGAGSLSLSWPSQSIQCHKAGEQTGMPTSNPHYSPISNPSLFI